MSTCQYRGHRFDPLSGKLPYVRVQLSLRATTTEPMRPGSMFSHKRSPRSEKPTHHGGKAAPAWCS